jgi:DNA-binding SARP family transcriptional activator/tetratricopeptide (TPR) repeat protein
VEFRLFGEVEALAAGRPLDVGTPRQQAVLAVLLVDAGRPVTVETLVDRIWGERPPVETRNVLYSHVSRIRQLLKRGTAISGTEPAIERRHAGYVLTVEPDLVDIHRFARLVDGCRDPQCADADRARVLAQALDLWRGTPLAALSGEWVEQVRNSWHRRRLDAIVQWAQAELRLRRPAAVIATLPNVITENPLMEPLEGLLMEALHAAGRSAEAVDRYAALRQRLADELGTDPGPDLRNLHRAILRGETPASAPAPPVAAAAAAPPVPAAVPRVAASPAQLPPDVSGFTGRARELDGLDSLLETTGDPGVISTINGTAGIGKTALAVHWAHRVADRFDGGQLYVNLQGFDATGSPVLPAEAVQRFLDAFGVPAELVPASLEAQVGLYRSLLAKRRVLVVLDNARDEEQVRPLLPGARGCMAVVTSRNRLAGLVTTTGAHPLILDLPSAAEARELLAGRLGADRLAAEPDAVDEIVQLCARLPLALAIVAARAATNPSFGLAVLAGELRDARGSLDEFAGTDRATDARAVFSWSYRQLDPAAARLFRLLGLHPGPDVAAEAAAGLAGLQVRAVRPLLAELCRGHLLTEHVPGRYTCHDLLRAYATELTHNIDTDAERRGALRRVLGFYTHSAEAADRLLNPYRDNPSPLPEPPSGVAPARPADRAQALAWFRAEYAVLLAVIRQATDFDACLCPLAWTLSRFFGYQGHWHDSITVLDIALDAALRLGGPHLLAVAHRSLGTAKIRLGRFDDAHAHLLRALDLYREAGDSIGEAHTHRNYAWLLERLNRHPEALGYAKQALDLFRAAGHRSGQARALNAIGWFNAMLGRYDDAVAYCEQALLLQRELGDRFGQAETYDSLGYAHHRLGQHAPAVVSYRTAAELYHEFDDRYNEADTMTSLGDVHRAAGDLGAARAVLDRALEIFTQMGHRDAEKVRARLDHLDAEPVRSSR